MFEKIMGLIGYVPKSRLMMAEKTAQEFRAMFYECHDRRGLAARLPECAGGYCFQCKHAIIRSEPVIRDPADGIIQTGISSPQKKIVSGCKKYISCPDFCERG